MSSNAQPQLTVAIVSFFPNYGHVLPLLRIGQELRASGHDIICYLPEECRLICDRYSFSYVSLGTGLPPDHKTLFLELSQRSTLYMACSEGWDLRLRYWLPIKQVMWSKVETVRRSLSKERPDCILVDPHVFGEWYVGLARDLEIPLVRHHVEGTYMWYQSWYTAANGIGERPKWLENVGEYLYRGTRYLLTRFIRVRHFRKYISYKKESMRMDEALASVLSHTHDHSPKVLDITTGLGVLEQQYLSDRLDLSDKRRFFLAPIPHGMNMELPEDLQAWFRSVSWLPVVYLSFGTMARLDRRLVAALMAGLQRLGVAALWALSAEQQKLLQGLTIPETFRIEAFMPQPVILAHPSVRCFITHAGAGGAQEGLMSGKPMCCIPFMWDQNYSASVIELLGAGRIIRKNRASASSISRVVEELLTDPAYRVQCEKLSQDLELHRAAHPVAQLIHTFATA